MPLYCKVYQPADDIYRTTDGFKPDEVPKNSLMLQLNQSGTWFHEDPYEKPA